MVHQRHQRHARFVHQLFEQRQGALVRQLAAQVQPVLGAVHPGALAVDHRVDHLLQVFQPVAAVAHVADRHRVQHRGDAVGHHQRVVAAHRRMGRPVDVRARGEKLVQIVGMQLDQPREQPAAVAVQRLWQPAWAVGEAADHAVLHLQRTLHHLVIQHQLNVIDDHQRASSACGACMS